MSTETTSSKLGAVIYLKSRGPILAALVSDFKQRWPDESLVDGGKDGSCALFTAGDSQFVIELRNQPVPHSVTDAVLPDALAYWPTAEVELAAHVAHLTVATGLRKDTELFAARALTKIVTSLLSVADAVGACWLNGPVLHSAQGFIEIATEMLDAGVPPLPLWVGSHWAPQEGLLYTKGMVQLDAPEIMIRLQSEPTQQWFEYLLEVAYHAMTSGAEIHDGDTIDGPAGLLRIESISGAEHPSRTGLVLVPVRPN